MYPLVDHAWVIRAVDAAVETITEPSLTKRHMGEKKPDNPTTPELRIMGAAMSPMQRRTVGAGGNSPQSDVRRVQVTMQLLMPEREADPTESGGSSFEWAVYTRMVEEALEGYAFTDATGHVLEMGGFETVMQDVVESETTCIQVVAMVWWGEVRRDVGSNTTMVGLTT